jgi:DNA-binding GntR family transcriptional regulator
VTTTLWLPDAERLGVAVSEGKSLANAICEALALDIAMQRLLPGDTLPKQRLLARRLSLSLGTVHRAYQLATTRGLIRGEVGRGCFVLEHRNDQSLSRLSLPSPTTLSVRQGFRNPTQWRLRVAPGGG